MEEQSGKVVSPTHQVIAAHGAGTDLPSSSSVSLEDNDAKKGNMKDASLAENEHFEDVQLRRLHMDRDDLVNNEVQNTDISAGILGKLISQRVGGTPYFEVGIEGDSVLAPLDLGAEATIITKDLFDSLKMKNPNLQLISQCAKLYNASNGTIKNHGRCWLTMKFGYQVLEHPVYVCDINTPLLVGADVLWRLSCVIDLVDGVLRSGIKDVVPFSDNWGGVNSVQVLPQVCDVEVYESVVVPRFTEAQRVMIKLAKGQDIGGKDGTVEASKAMLELGLEILPCIVPTNRFWAWIYVRNCQPRDITLNRYKRIGKVVALDAHAFDTGVIVVGDKLREDKEASDSIESTVVPNWLRHGDGTFMVRRVCDSRGVPAISEQVESCEVVMSLSKTLTLVKEQSQIWSVR